MYVGCIVSGESTMCRCRYCTKPVDFSESKLTRVCSKMLHKASKIVEK